MWDLIVLVPDYCLPIFFAGPNPRLRLLQWFKTFGPHEGLNQHRKQTITDKTYDESQMGIR